MPNQPRVVFVIVCWNNQDLIRECLNSIKSQTYQNTHTILVDNGSRDDSVSVAKNSMPEIEIIEAGENLGFAKGNNVGIARAFEDNNVHYIALLNTDARLSPDWAEKIIEFAQLKPRAACLQSTTLDYYNHEIIDSTHIFIARNSQGTQGSWRNIYEAELGPKKVFGVNAAACVITRRFIEAQPFKNQVFDEAMFMYLEDVDLATRATLMGWDNYLVPTARAFHMGSASSGKNPGFSLYLTFRNNSALLYKNLSFKLIIRMLPKLIKGDFDTIRTLKNRGDQAAANKVIRGRIRGIVRLPRYTLKRYKMRKTCDVPTEYLWELMNKGY